MMKLSRGMTAPAFETEDIFGAPVSLAAYAGKGLLLSFFRNGACAICNLQVHRLIEKYPEYHRQGLEIVAVFESPRASILQYVAKQDAPFPIVADPQAALYELYGVETSQEKITAQLADTATEPWRRQISAEAEAIGYSLTHEEGSNFFRLPADFLIGPDQRIHAAFYSEIVGTHLPFEEIEGFLAELV